MRKLVYLHGFRSSGQTATGKRLQKHLPDFEVICPDIPLDPVVAMTALRDIAKGLGPDDLIVGTSMGGMFALLFKGWKRVIVNPSLHPSEHMRPDIGKRLDFFTPRRDGMQSFQMTEKLVKKYEALEARIFDPDFGIFGPLEERDENVLAFFGTRDPVVNCREEYLRHFSQFEMFEGEHRLTPESTLHSLVPGIELMAGL